MRRRVFINYLGGTVAWPLATHAQQAKLAIIVFRAPAHWGDGRSPSPVSEEDERCLTKTVAS